MRPAPWPDFDGSQSCSGVDDKIFFPAYSHTLPKQAVDLCAGCDFNRPCLAYALTHHVGGIWAGTNESQRTQLRKSRGIDLPGLDGPVAAFSSLSAQRRDGGAS